MTVEETIIDRLYTEFKELLSYLYEKGEISFLITADEYFRKALLLAAASYFERRICDDLISFTSEISDKNEILVEFVKNKAIARQYHTFFNWNASNANQFFGLFGGSFYDSIKSEVNNDDGLAGAIKAFMELGSERNRLVHQDFGTFPLEKTSDEIYKLYETALPFVKSI